MEARGAAVPAGDTRHREICHWPPVTRIVRSSSAGCVKCVHEVGGVCVHAVGCVRVLGLRVGAEPGFEYRGGNGESKVEPITMTTGFSHI